MPTNPVPKRPGLASDDALLAWMLEAEPWTRHRALIDLAGVPPDDPVVTAARCELLRHALVRALVERAMSWPGPPLKRHNDAAHPIHAVAALGDLGLRVGDPGVAETAEAIIDRFDGEQFASLLWLPRFLTKDDADREAWTWMRCDAPVLLGALAAFGYGDSAVVRQAASSLLDRAASDGWRCGASDALPRFSGPGRREDPCPMATLYTLRAVSLLPDHHDHPAVSTGIEVLLRHWQDRADYKLRMFGIGTDFRKLRYPFVWYDVLHVAEVLSRYPTACCDPRFAEMIEAITGQADTDGRYTAGAMFRSWKEWGFADKRTPSPWLTFLVHRMVMRRDRASSEVT